MGGGERGKRTTQRGRAACGPGRGYPRPPGGRERAARADPRLGTDFGTEWDGSILAGGNREEPGLLQLCKQEVVPSVTPGRGARGVVTARRPPRCGLRQPPRSPTHKLVATNRRPRVPLAASGGVGGRARGRGRLADAAANWWADPESPRKRGRLSAVRQARLCGSGSPLLQHSPWQSRSLSAQPSPSAARRRPCSSRPLHLCPPFVRLLCLKLLRTSAAPVPAAAGEYLPVVRRFAQLWPGSKGGWPRGPDGVRGRSGVNPVREAGARRTRREDPATGRLPSRLARACRPSAPRARDKRPPWFGGETPAESSSQITSLLFPFLSFYFSKGGRGEEV